MCEYSILITLRFPRTLILRTRRDQQLSTSKLIEAEVIFCRLEILCVWIGAATVTSVKNYEHSTCLDALLHQFSQHSFHINAGGVEVCLLRVICDQIISIAYIHFGWTSVAREVENYEVVRLDHTRKKF